MTSMPELILNNSCRDAVMRPLVLITGISGAGKSYLASSLTFPSHWVVVDLDLIGRKTREGKWVVDPQKVSFHIDVLVGTTDNLIEVVQVAKKFNPKPLTLVNVEPSPEIFRQATALKAKEQGPSSPFYKGWLDSSTWPDRKILDRIDLKRNNWVAKLDPVRLVIVRNTDQRSSILSGFHRSPVRAAGSSASEKGGQI